MLTTIVSILVLETGATTTPVKTLRTSNDLDASHQPNPTATKQVIQIIVRNKITLLVVLVGVLGSSVVLIDGVTGDAAVACGVIDFVVDVVIDFV